uniref:SAM domain-containing protein n=1 Tax=Tetraodon nigroviridis TaxID=99883 RepID=H3C6Q6_TETNG
VAAAEEEEEGSLVPDLSHVVPETELLDNSVQKGRAHLSIKVHKPRPSKSRCHDNISSTDRDNSLEKRLRSPGSGCPTERTNDSLLHTLLGRPVRSREDEEVSLTQVRGRYHQLTNTTSQETLGSSSPPPPPHPSADCSRLYKRSRRPESEVLVSDCSQDSPAEPEVPTAVLDSQTRRRFLDLGVTLRRSYIRVRKEKPNRLSCEVGQKEPSGSPSRSSGSPVTFSWFSEGQGTLSPSTPPCSPKLTPLSSPRPQRSADSDDVSCPPSSSSPPHWESCRSSQPYHALSEEDFLSPQVWEEPLSPVSSWTTQQVCHWLRGLSMDRYVPEFSARDVDGQELVQMDGKKLKGLGVLSASDRGALKRRIKEIQSAAEKERKALEKMEKQRRRKQDQSRS